jgi:hypothetical protein
MEDRAVPGQPLGPAPKYEGIVPRDLRLRSVLAGRRHLGQQVLEIAMVGYPSLAEARRALAKELPRLIYILPERR